MKLKALILDRDGTLITHVPYLSEPDSVALMPGVRAGLEKAIRAGVSLFMHTNQSGVGRGWFPLAAVEACNQRLIELLDLGPSPFTRICIAPEHPDSPEEYRKPSSRFAAEIIRDFGFHPHELCYIGDRGTDLATAHAAGTLGVGVATGLDDLRGELRALGLENQYPVFDNFEAAIDHLFPAS